jgi:hypothetical protein
MIELACTAASVIGIVLAVIGVSIELSVILKKLWRRK